MPLSGRAGVPAKLPSDWSGSPRAAVCFQIRQAEKVVHFGAQQLLFNWRRLLAEWRWWAGVAMGLSSMGAVRSGDGRTSGSPLMMQFGFDAELKLQFAGSLQQLSW